MKPEQNNSEKQTPSWLQNILGKGSQKTNNNLDKSLSDSTRTAGTAKSLDESVKSGLNASQRAEAPKQKDTNSATTHVNKLNDERSKITVEEAMWFGS